MPTLASTAPSRPLDVAIVGVTGAVGAELIACLEKRAFPVARLRALASPRSAGARLETPWGALAVEAVEDDSFAGADCAFFSAGAGVSRRFAPAATQRGCVVVDNSSAFRMDPGTPLVVPEVNGALLDANPRLVANPNCTAAVSVMALAPIHARNPIRRVIGATYQAASGAGAAAMAELTQSTRAWLTGEPFQPKVLPHPYAFNLFSHTTPIDPVTGYNDEETKVMAEIRRILDAPGLRISVTCVRVPVLRAHSVALSLECERAVAPEEVVEWLSQAPGVRLVNDAATNHFPMPAEASGLDEVLVGRIRRDLSDPDGRTISLFLSGDQLLKGAALNAVQIAERLFAKGGGNGRLS